MTDSTLQSMEFASPFKSLVDKFGDESFVVEMLSVFVVDGATASDRLMSAIMLSDAASIRNSLHSLKNILGTMQSDALFLLAEQASDAFRSGDQARLNSDAAALIAGTRSLVQAAESALAELRKAVAS